MIFYVIGNGFDLHYNLPTSYCHFKHYLIQNGKMDIVKKIDDFAKILVISRSYTPIKKQNKKTPSQKNEGAFLLRV